ncbi:MAG: hypothetical protein ACRD4O_04490 [Bryobacteraceae bacterium]
MAFTDRHIRRHTAVLYKDGKEIARKAVTLASAFGIAELAPDKLPLSQGEHFAGNIADFSVVSRVLSEADIQQAAAHPPNFDLIEFDPGSKTWPVQTRAQAGLRVPQNPATLPKPLAPFPAPVAKPAAHISPLLTPLGPK